MTELTRIFDWMGPSNDSNDEQFGHVVELASIDEADRYDAVLVGEPFDLAVIGRKGAAEGPSALREHLAGTKTHHFDAGPVRSVADLGDVTPGDGEPESVADLQRRVRAVAERVHDTAAFPVFLGGDNSMTYPNAAPLLDDGSLGVINFDAHLDVREVREGRGPTSGTPYRQLYEAGLDAYACVGARHFETSTGYAEYVRERGGEVITAEEVGDDEIGAVDRALDAMDDVDQLYVSVDLDVLDASAAPGVSAPTPGGITTRELFRMLRLLGSEAQRASDSRAGDPRDSEDRLAGFEVVECAPPLESGTANLTATAGARAVAHVLSARPEGGSDRGSGAAEGRR